MLTIRLQRVGRTNQAVFRIVLAEKHRSATKKVVEVLGHYDPRTKEFGIKDPERLKYWVEEVKVEQPKPASAEAKAPEAKAEAAPVAEAPKEAPKAKETPQEANPSTGSGK
ncbi:MAG: 30S ribosomal protein S16 [Parcubacteria group bacterium GW2011_GWA2_51_12]|nr:MAG: 30S ribosomal protein S16 [Parcubacteria group bacterium GW2011_GWA2_51_12]